MENTNPNSNGRDDEPDPSAEISADEDEADVEEREGSPPDDSDEPEEKSAANVGVEYSDAGTEQEQEVQDLTEDTPNDSEDDDESPEEIVPELHPNVYRDPFGGYDVSDPEDLADAVGEIDKQAAITIEHLIRQVNKLQEESAQFKQKAKQKQKEFQNFKQRKNSETEELRDTATKEFIKDALPIRDNLVRALEQDSEDIQSGVELIRQEFDELLEQEGVTIIDPDYGSDVDPEVHEVMTRVESDAPEGQVHECFRPGYKMEGVVIRPARVTVSGSSEQ